MAYDEALAERVREALARRRGIAEKKMFGGLCFLTNGNMCCGVQGALLMVRIGADAYESCLRKPGVRPMDFTGRPLRGMVYVDKKGYRGKDGVRSWVVQGLEHARSLPPK